ncbi:Ca2+-binding EF-hand superfamily protein [Sphingomonas sp. SORGH_AS 950]|uniref:hypothetical protein n=1 Tax=Sphingomonas sp. SORGH_AS_0950 TaxID=3041792 RepID=UPI00278773CA|nr:hypothetical protein [Sphingomonas sp. SORGH_AS_0950]MDQ1155888.1 Ca2+-binding EF-hand superfamily protein [Sphingomonas sp. SORGH_AS_0950]
MKTFLRLTGIILMLAPTTAMADAKANVVDQAFRKYDRNKDGYIAKAEIPAGHELLEHFDMADRDHDGKLDKREFGIALKMI